MRTGGYAYRPEPLRAPGPLPAITDEPKQAFLVGWWSGIAVGAVIGAGLCVMLVQAVR